MQQQKISEDQLREASQLVSRHLGLEVIEAVLHGSIVRGFGDPNSDTDVCFLLNRPVTDYLGTTSTPFFETTLDDRRRKTLQVSHAVSRDLGWSLMISTIDMRGLLRGLMTSSTFSLLAYEAYAEKNKDLDKIFTPVAKDYSTVSNLVFRCGEQIQSGIRTYNTLPQRGAEFKQERTFLGTLWSCHRLLAYLTSDKQHARTLDELVEYNQENWGQWFSSGFSKETLSVIDARTQRGPFVAPEGVSDVASANLREFVEKVLAEATRYVKKTPTSYPTTQEEATEMVDLYRQLLDWEKRKQDAQRQEQDKRFPMAA